MADILLSPQLQHLADEVAVAANPYRAVNDQPPGWVEKHPEKLKAFERYGSSNVFINSSYAAESSLSLFKDAFSPVK